MPMYEYRCRSCGNEFEQIRSIAERDMSPHCQRCGSTNGERLVSAYGYANLGTAAGLPAKPVFRAPFSPTPKVGGKAKGKSA